MRVWWSSRSRLTIWNFGWVVPGRMCRRDLLWARSAAASVGVWRRQGSVSFGVCSSVIYRSM